jgi:hypothetical protein
MSIRPTELSTVAARDRIRPRAPLPISRDHRRSRPERRLGTPHHARGQREVTVDSELGLHGTSHRTPPTGIRTTRARPPLPGGSNAGGMARATHGRRRGADHPALRSAAVPDSVSGPVARSSEMSGQRASSMSRSTSARSNNSSSRPPRQMTAARVRPRNAHHHQRHGSRPAVDSRSARGVGRRIRRVPHSGGSCNGQSRMPGPRAPWD